MMEILHLDLDLDLHISQDSSHSQLPSHQVFDDLHLPIFTRLFQLEIHITFFFLETASHHQGANDSDRSNLAFLRIT